MTPQAEAFLQRRQEARALENAQSHAGRIEALESAVATLTEDVRDIRASLATIEQTLAGLTDAVRELQEQATKPKGKP